MPAHFENGENVTVAKSELALTRCRNNLKTPGSVAVKSSLQDFDAKYVYLHPKNRSVSFQKTSRNVLFFIIFECSHDFVSKMCRLEFHFQNLPFPKVRGKNVPFSCEREANPSHFSPFSKCFGIVRM